MAGYVTLSASYAAAGGTEDTWKIALEREAKAPAVSPSLSGPQGSARAGPLALGIGGMVLVIGGGLLVGLSAARYSSLEDRCAHACDPSSWKPWQTIEPVGDVLLIAGGAALLGALGWWIAMPSAKAAAVGTRF
jgi:hypothetical protein